MAKKLFSMAIAVVICLSMTLTSFAQITNVKQFFDSNTGYVYLFGKFDEGDKSVGFEVNNHKYLLDSQNVDQETGLTDFEKSSALGGVFGIGLIDYNNLLAATYEAIPYSKNSSNEEVFGTSILVRNPDLDDSRIKDIKINGISLEGFNDSSKYYYYPVNNESELTSESFSVETYKQYAKASVEKVGKNYVISSTAPDAETQQVEIRVQSQKEYQNNSDIPVSTYKYVKDGAISSPEVAALTSGDGLIALQFDISNLTSINDRAKLNLSVAANKTDNSEISVYGVAAEESLTDAFVSSASVAELNKILRKKISSNANQTNENDVYNTASIDITDYLNDRLERSYTTATIFLNCSEGATIYVKDLATSAITFTNWQGALKSLTVNGKAIADFYSGTLKNEFYYGLDVLPEDANDLPSVAVSAVDENAVITQNVTKKDDYYINKITVISEGVSRDYYIYFKKLAAVTQVVYPTYNYDVRTNYVNGEAATLSGFRFTYVRRDTSDPTSAGLNRYSAFAYNVPEKQGYVPVSYDMTAIRFYDGSDGTNYSQDYYAGISVYGFNKDLTGFEPAEVYNNPTALQHVNNYLVSDWSTAGFDASFKLADIVTPKDYGSREVAFSSNIVKNGWNIICYTSDNTTGLYQRMIYNNDYKMPITVKYVEKNVDENSLATLRGIRVDSVDIKNFDKNNKEYYYGIEGNSFPTTEDITSVAGIAEFGNVSAATYEEENGGFVANIKVESNDKSTTNTYKVHFRKMLTKNVTVADNMAVCQLKNYGNYAVKSKDSTWAVRMYDNPSITDSDYNKLLYVPFNLGNEYSMTEFKITVKPRYNVSPLSFYSYADSDIDSTLDETTGGIKATTTFNGYKGYNSAVKLGSFDTFTHDTDTTVELDASKIVRSPNGNFIIIVAKDNKDGKESYVTNISAQIKYVEKNPLPLAETSAELSSISYGQNSVDGFDAAKYEYYYALDCENNLTTDDILLSDINAVFKYGDIGEITKTEETNGVLVSIPVTSKDKKTTNTYKVHFRKILTQNVTVADNTAVCQLKNYGKYAVASDGSSWAVRMYDKPSITDSDYNKLLYVPFNLGNEYNMTEFKITAKPLYNVSPLSFYAYADSDIDSTLDETTGGIKTTSTFNGYKGYNSAVKLGSIDTFTHNADTTVELDTSKIVRSPNGNFIIIVAKDNKDGQESYITNISAEIKYYAK